VELKEFVAQVPGFAALSHPEKVLHFGWFLHTHRGQDRFDIKAIRSCYDDQHIEPPNLSDVFAKLIARKPRVLLKDGAGYRLEHSTRQRLDEKYKEHETTTVVSQLLADLPGKIADDAERLFLSEALKCYRAKAFRAATIMAWNLAYDHLLRWILVDAQRAAEFNAKIVARVGAKKGTGLVMAVREDFEDLKESEVLDICSNAGILPSHNLKQILDMQLTKRNIAAHPSLIEIERPTADDTIHTLVVNIVLRLT
jgi:hypothetical protein